MTTHMRRGRPAGSGTGLKDVTLTNMQKILDYIKAYYDEVGLPPTQTEIAKAVTGKASNVGNLNPLIQKLIEDGFLYRAVEDKNAARVLMVVDPPPRPYYYRRDE